VISKIRVLLADDHPIVRMGLARLINAQPDIEIVGEASDGQDAITLTRQILPNVVVMDVNMPKMNGIVATRIIRNDFPEVQVIGLSMGDEVIDGRAMQVAGASDYLMKSGPADAILAAIRRAGALSQPDANVLQGVVV
jgi:DNA-binding NarL/FixJ family response regulator